MNVSKSLCDRFLWRTRSVGYTNDSVKHKSVCIRCSDTADVDVHVLLTHELKCITHGFYTYDGWFAYVCPVNHKIVYYLPVEISIIMSWMIDTWAYIPHTNQQHDWYSVGGLLAANPKPSVDILVDLHRFENGNIFVLQSPGTRHNKTCLSICLNHTTLSCI